MKTGIFYAVGVGTEPLDLTLRVTLTFTSMQPTGQSFAHLPQPTQRSASTAA